MRRISTVALAALILVAAVSTAHAKSIHVDPNADPLGLPKPDGSKKAPFPTLKEAVCAARARLPAATVIRVAPGTLHDVYPVVLDVPGLHVAGSTTLARDARGLATHPLAGESRLEFSLAVSTSPQFLKVLADDVRISGLSLDGIASANGTHLIFIDGKNDIDGGGAIEGFAIEGCFLTRGNLNTRLASGKIHGNLMTAGLIGAQICGGPAECPPRVVLSENRFAGHGRNGAHILGSQGSLVPPAFPAGAGALEVAVRGNDFSGNGAKPALFNGLPQFGCGLQFFINDFRTGDQNADARIEAHVHDNSFDDNQNYGVVVGELVSSLTTEARYSFRGTFRRNTYGGNGNNRAMFGFGFFSRSLKLGTGPYMTFVNTSINRYPRGSDYEIKAVDDELNVPVDAATLLFHDDPFVAPAPEPCVPRTLAFDFDVPLENPDIPGESLGNLLIFNRVPFVGQSVSNYPDAPPCSD